MVSVPNIPSAGYGVDLQAWRMSLSVLGCVCALALGENITEVVKVMLCGRLTFERQATLDTARLSFEKAALCPSECSNNNSLQ